MNIFQVQRNPFLASTFDKVAFLLILSILFWATGAPMFLKKTHADSLTSISDTLSTSELGVLSKHTIQYTNSTTTSSNETIKIQFDPTGSAFTEAFSAATTTDISVTGATFTNTCTGGPTDELTVVGNYNNGTDENLTFTVCPGDSIPPGTLTFGIGTTTKLITNPGSQGSYEIRVNGSQVNSGGTRVYVLSGVTLTAAVNSSFTFTVTGLATSTAINGATTTKSSTSVALPFGVLASGTPVILGQQLQVTTNARNGFAVTVQENQNPLSSTGADIDLFANGATTSTPIVWVPPTATLDQEATYGHIGLTSDDADEGGGEFVGTKFAGNFNTPRLIFSHTGPADGTTQNKGLAKVAYEIQISDLQEAGSDYTNILTYVATPTF